VIAAAVPTTSQAKLGSEGEGMQDKVALFNVGAGAFCLGVGLGGSQMALVFLGGVVLLYGAWLAAAKDHARPQ
jgi:hypothetical protein